MDVCYLVLDITTNEYIGYRKTISETDYKLIPICHESKEEAQFCADFSSCNAILEYEDNGDYLFQYNNIYEIVAMPLDKYKQLYLN